MRLRACIARAATESDGFETSQSKSDVPVSPLRLAGGVGMSRGHFSETKKQTPETRPVDVSPLTRRSPLGFVLARVALVPVHETTPVAIYRSSRRSVT